MLSERMTMLSERMKEIYQSPQDLVVWVASWIDEVVQLENALAYCQDDKEVMQNEIDVLKAELAAHRENEGDECPLCACEAERDALIRVATELSDKMRKGKALTGVDFVELRKLIAT